MYTDTLDVKLANNENTVELMKAAHKYQVDKLIKLCVGALLDGLTEDIAISRLMLADLLGSTMLQRRCLTFITSSSARIANIQDHEAFKDLARTRPHLLAHILAAAFPSVKRQKRSD